MAPVTCLRKYEISVYTKKSEAQQARNIHQLPCFFTRQISINFAMLVGRVLILHDTLLKKTLMKLFVAGLPFDMDDNELQEIFTEHGTVASAKVITDRETGKSRGFGFVEFNDDAQAQAAIQALNGASIEGRNIVVKVAEDKPRGGSGGGGGSYGDRRPGGGGRGGFDRGSKPRY